MLIDFSCGFQSYKVSGIRSRHLRVARASASSSAKYSLPKIAASIVSMFWFYLINRQSSSGLCYLFKRGNRRSEEFQYFRDILHVNSCCLLTYLMALNLFGVEQEVQLEKLY